MKATIDLPFGRCPVCHEEVPIQTGRLCVHGSRSGECAGSNRPADDANEVNR